VKHLGFGIDRFELVEYALSMITFVGVLPKKNPLELLIDVNVMSTSPGIEACLVVASPVAFSFTSTILHFPSNPGISIESLRLQERMVKPKIQIKKNNFFIFRFFLNS